MKDFSDMGTQLSAVAKAESGERFVVSGSYMVFYHHMKNDIYIDRVLYGRRDYVRILFDDWIGTGKLYF